jgi:DnaJ-class molecular chaperone
MVCDNLLYNRLEVGPNASENDIKKAYARLSKIWHPDKNPNNIEEATKKFQEINEAKEILLNSDKRLIYDEVGMDINKQQSQHQHQSSPFSFFENIINQHFSFNMNATSSSNGSGSGAGVSPQHQPDSFENIVANLHITLEQIYNNESVSFQYKQKVFCNKCDGNGTNDGLAPICLECSGKGMKIQIIKSGFIIQQLMSSCNICNGSGKCIKEECDLCNGLGYSLKEKSISIPLKSVLTT